MLQIFLLSHLAGSEGNGPSDFNEGHMANRPPLLRMVDAGIFFSQNVWPPRLGRIKFPIAREERVAAAT
jgi:hypothetical protein